MAEPIEMQFGIWTHGRKNVLGGVHTGAAWRLPFNHPCALYFLFQGRSAVSMSGSVTRSNASDEMLDESASHSAADAAAVSERRLSEMSLNADRSCSIDRALTENCSSSDLRVGVDPAEAAAAVANSQTRCWTLNGFVSECSNNVASDHLPPLNVGDQLTSADDDCDVLSVGNISSQQLSNVCGFSSASSHHVPQCSPECECCLDNSHSFAASHEWMELFCSRECSVKCSKHLAHDSLHIVLNVVRHSEVDSSVFCDASLSIVKSEIYLTQVMSLSCDSTFLCFSVL